MITGWGHLFKRRQPGRLFKHRQPGHTWRYTCRLWSMGCLLGLMVCLLTACGFSVGTKRPLRNPEAYQRLSVMATGNTPAAFTTTLNRLLRANGIANAPKSVPTSFYLQLSQYHDDSDDLRPITSSSIATPITYHLRVTAQLELPNHHSITPPRPLLIEHTIYINTNQIQTPGTAHAIRQAMQQQLAMMVYYWLVSPSVQTALVHAASVHKPLLKTATAASDPFKHGSQHHTRSVNDLPHPTPLAKNLSHHTQPVIHPRHHALQA